MVVLDRGIDDRELLERRHRRGSEKGHEAQLDLMRGLEFFLVALADVHDRLHIHLVEGGQDRIVPLRPEQALRHAFSEPCHRRPLLGPRARGSARGRAGGPVFGLNGRGLGASALRRGRRGRFRACVADGRFEPQGRLSACRFGFGRGAVARGCRGRIVIPRFRPPWRAGVRAFGLDMREHIGLADTL